MTWPIFIALNLRGDRRRKRRAAFCNGYPACTVQLLERRELLTCVHPVSELADAQYSDYLVLFDEQPGSQSYSSSSVNDFANDHREFAHELEHLFGEPILVRHEFTRALNGLALSLTDHQAEHVAELPTVADVLADSTYKLQQNSADETGARGVWDGSALAGVDGTFGEGVLIGIIDSGIDFDNPSFAATGPVDGFVHTNPFGEGTYLGVCDPTHPDHDPAFACNDKVVGAYDFTDDTLINDANFADHGTSVAGIAAGNFVVVPLPGTDNTGEISGVAPHANLISYDVCDSSDNCSSIAIMAAVDQAIADGVDIINMSIGGPTESPWVGVMAQAMWSAYDAGIFVAVSAGNEGPDVATITAPADAPWVTAVAAADDLLLTSVHVDAVGLNVPDSLLQIPAIRGENLNVNSTLGPAKIVHVADVGPGDHLGSSALPAGSLAGQVAMIDRGESLFETKVRNAFEAGAVGVIMVNNVAGPLVTMAGVSDFDIPSVMISRENGQELRQWIQKHPDAQIQINAQQQQEFTAVSSFSSRGENQQADTLTPHLAAPGAANMVLAPTATGGADDWIYFSGTSAASPHVAGAAALLAALHPTWTPAEIQSALQTTAQNGDVVTGASLQKATAFDVGSGQLDVAAAANAGVVLNEFASEFTLANPNTGGDASSLNLASFVDSSVDGEASWSRTLRSTQATNVAWTPTFVADDGLSLSLASAELTVPANGEVSFELDATISADASFDWLFGELILTPNADLPTAHFPVAVKRTAVAAVIVEQSGSGTDSSENGTVDDYTIRLQTNPDGLVRVRIEAPKDLEVSSDGTTFASSIEFSIIDTFPRTVSVRAIDDNLAESTQHATITHRIFESSNSDYPVGLAIDGASVRVVDNDLGSLALSLDGTSLIEGTGFATATVTRSANSDIGQPLQVNIGPADGLAFENTNGSEIQTAEIPTGESSATFRIRAVDNSFIDGDRSRSITLSAASFTESEQQLAVIDDDFASIKAIESSGITIVSRSGTTDSFAAELRTQPDSDVVFDVVTGNPAGVSVDIDRLTFTPNDWNVPKTITVTGVDDGQSGVAQSDVRLEVVANLSNSSYANVQPAVVIVNLTERDTSVPSIISPNRRILNNTPTYRWSAADDAVSYDLYVEEVGTSDSPIIDVTTTATSFEPGLQEIGAYRYWVRANYASGGTSAWIGEVYQISTVPDINPLPSNSADARPEISWTPVAGADSYQLFISNRTTGQTVAYEQNLTSNSFAPSADFSFGVHRVWVRAIASSGFMADWSSPVDYNVGPQLLGPLTSTFERRPRFAWSVVPGVASYDLFIRQPDGSAIVENLAANTFQPSSDLTAGRHVWWVRGITANGAKGPWSSAGESFVGGRTTLNTPATESNQAAPLFEWDAVVGANEYELFLNRTDITEHILFRRFSDTSWQSKILMPGNYTAWVRPISEAQEAGSWSPAHRFTIAEAAGQLTTQSTEQQVVSFSNSPTWQWEPVAAAASYDVFVHDGNTAQQYNEILSSSFAVPDVGESTIELWVRAVDEFGLAGPWSSPATIDTTGRAVAEVPQITETSVSLQWTNVIGADRYVLQVDNLTTGETRVIREDQWQSNSFVFNTPEAGRYRYWVRAIRNSNPDEGFWSIAVDFEIE